MKSISTANNFREVAGVGSVINVRHEGGLKRPVENSRIDNFTSKDINQPKKKETGFANPSFGGVGSEER